MSADYAALVILIAAVVACAVLAFRDASLD
jgi:hypothetical protein